MTMKKTIFFLLTILCARLNAQIPDFEPSKLALQYAKEQPPYTWQTLRDMALWASGAKSIAYEREVADAVAKLRASPDLPTDAKERGEYVLRFMYKNYLRQYSLNQTRLDTLFDKGTFNCVSSSVFYLILGVSVNLDIQGVMTHDHAFVTLHIHDGVNVQEIDVETTNKYGFDPGTQKSPLPSAIINRGHRGRSRKRWGSAGWKCKARLIIAEGRGRKQSPRGEQLQEGEIRG